MLASRDENLLTGNLVGTVALRNGFRPQQTKIGATMRFRQVHRAGPCAFNHLRQIGLLLLIGSMNENGGNRALREARIHHQREVCRRHVFADRRMQRIGKPLTAKFRRDGKTCPATFAIGVIGLLEAIGNGNGPIVCALAALLVAGEIEREELFLCKLGSLAGNRLDHVRRRILKARQIVVSLQAEHVVQDKKRVFDRGLVNRHYRCSSAS